jgi:hypothetical protein
MTPWVAGMETQDAGAPPAATQLEFSAKFEVADGAP